MTAHLTRTSTKSVPTIGKPAPTIDKAARTSDRRAPTNTEATKTIGQHAPTSSKRAATSGKRTATSSKHAATSNNRTATRNKHAATRNKRTATSSKGTATAGNRTPTVANPARTSGRRIPTIRKGARTSGNPTATVCKEAPTARQPPRTTCKSAPTSFHRRTTTFRVNPPAAHTAHCQWRSTQRAVSTHERMQIRQGNTVRSLRAVEDFLDDNSATFPDIATSGARKKLGGAIATLSAHATDQSGSTISAQSGTQKTRALRAVLRGNYMAPIARIARADLPNTQELLPLRAPRGNPTTEKLAVAARGMAQAAAPYADVFISAGLPPDFIARLNAASDAMLQSIDQRSKNQGRTSGATKGLSATLRVARQTVHILDSFVRVALADDPALLANWNRIKRVQRSRVSTTAAPATPVAAPDAAQSITPAVVAAAA